jgi:hypothetical protein
MPRFVVLRHEFPAGHSRAAHWDLMFEWGQVLRTWAVPEEPFSAKGTVAEALADHRRAYLDYEGPVSGDRGTVTRWDAGEYRLKCSTDSRLEAVLLGQRLRGRLTIEAEEGGGHLWRVSFSADPTVA